MQQYLYCSTTQSIAFTYQCQQKPTLLKCFSCYGLSQNQKIDNFCNHCGGTNYITNQHPLALLLEEVLYRKICARPRDSLGRVEPINQVQEELQIKVVCKQCKNDCQRNYKFYCKLCQNFFICIDCAQLLKNNIYHQHTMSISPCNLSPLLKSNSSLFKDDLKRSKSSNVIASNKLSSKISSNKQSKLISDKQKRIKLNKSQEPNSIMTKSDQQSQNLQVSQQSSSVIIAQQVQLIQQQQRKQKLNQFLQQLQPTIQDPIKILDKIGIQNGKSYDFQNHNNSNYIQVNFPTKNKSNIQFSPNRQSIGFQNMDFQQKNCNVCYQKLNHLYSVCRTCQTRGNQYKVCNQCSDNNSYQHNSKHQFYQTFGSVFGRKSQFQLNNQIEQIDYHLQKSLQQQSLQFHPNPRNSYQTISYNDDFQSFVQKIQGKRYYPKPKDQLFKKSQSPKKLKIQKEEEKPICCDQSIIQIEYEDLFRSSEIKEDLQIIELKQKKSSNQQVTNSLQDTPKFYNFYPSQQKLAQPKQSKKRMTQISSQQQSQQMKYQQLSQKLNKMPSRMLTSQTSSSGQITSLASTPKKVHFDDFIDHDGTLQAGKTLVFAGDLQQMPYSTGYIKSQSNIDGKSNISHLRRQPELQQKKEQFIFYQYNCDGCGCSPIKNVRYHCEVCKDFDYCGDCYDQGLTQEHPHHFLKIDGLAKIKQQKMIILQQVDKKKKIHKEPELYQATNLGKAQRSRKNFEGFKSGISHMNASIKNLTRSVIRSSVNMTRKSLNITQKNLQYY